MVNSSLSKTLLNCIYEKVEIIFDVYNDSLKHFASFAIDILSEKILTAAGYYKSLQMDLV